MRDIRVLFQEITDVILTLSDAIAVIAVPGTRLINDIELHAEVDDLTFMGDAFSIKDLELSLLEGRGHLVLHYLDAGFITDDFIALLDCPDAADIQPHRGVELQCITARGGFRRAEHHADLHADLVDENNDTVGAFNIGGEFSECL